MKKIFLFILLLIFIKFSFSQVINKFGIKGGIILSQLSYSSNFSPGLVTDPKNYSFSCLKPDIGVYAEFFDSRTFCTSVEIHYLVKGEDVKNPLKVKYFETINNNTAYRYINVNNRLNYLSFQILPRWKFIVRSDDKMYLFGGPVFSYRVSNSSTDFSPSIEFENNKLLTGFKAGYGIELWDLFLLEISYSHDFTNAYAITYRSEKLERQHNSFELIAGFSLKKLLKINL
jgi:hypothetical protein